MKEFDKNKDWLLQLSRLNPNGLAVITKSQKYTFTTLNGLVNNAVQVLKKSGIKKEDHCAIISDNNFDFVIVVLALWRIGAVPVPLNIRLTNKELQNQVIFTDCKFIVIHKENKNNFAFDDSIITIEIPFADINLQSETTLINSFDNDKTSLMLFTSGSTDKPKAVVFTFNNFINSAEQTIDLINAHQNDSWLASLPFYHIGGFMIFVRALICGGVLIIPDSLAHMDVINFIKEFRPFFISFVSAQFLRIIDENLNPDKNIKAVFLGGGPVDNRLIISAKRKNWPVIKVYGSTETCSMVTALDLRNEIQKIDSAGKAIQGNSISIEGGENKGEIIIESRSIAKCYYKDLGTKLLNGKFHSNDFGFIDEEGYLFIEGRIDDVIISGGENINTKEITKNLLENPEIKDVFTFGVKDEQWGYAITSAVVLKDKKINEQILKEYLKSKIASYKIPKKIFFVKEIPKTELGKVIKEELLKLLNLY